LADCAARLAQNKPDNNKSGAKYFFIQELRISAGHLTECPRSPGWRAWSGYRSGVGIPPK
jgi:hypothetical protein